MWCYFQCLGRGLKDYFRHALLVNNKYIYTLKKAPRETQTLRAGCSKAESKFFAPPQTLFPGAQDGKNLLSWRWPLPLPTNLFGEDRCTQFRVIVVTDPQTRLRFARDLWRFTNVLWFDLIWTHNQTHKPGHRQDQLQYTAPHLASSQCNKYIVDKNKQIQNYIQVAAALFS